jgi:DNA-binding transcriptional LysR family regulator
MDLRQLRYFKVLAAHQHFGRAAAVLHIAQPALSRQIQLLESELGIQLVERHARGASLTLEGELLLDRATFLLRYSDQIKVDIIDLQGAARGPVALGLPPALASVLVLPLTRAVRNQYPEIKLRVSESFSPSLSESLEQGVLDIAVLSGPIPRRRRRPGSCIRYRAHGGIFLRVDHVSHDLCSRSKGSGSSYQAGSVFPGDGAVRRGRGAALYGRNRRPGGHLGRLPRPNRLFRHRFRLCDVQPGAELCGFPVTRYRCCRRAVACNLVCQISSLT